MSRRILVVSGMAALVAASASFAQTPTKRKPSAAVPAKKAVPPAAKPAPLTEEQRIVHILNRLGFGPRPGDVARVKAMGVDVWIDRQLHPETIDDSALESRLSEFQFLGLTAADLGEMETASRKGNLQALQRAAQRRQQAQMMKDGGAGTPDPAPPGNRDRREIMASLTDDERKAVMEAQAARRNIGEAGRQLVTDKIVRAASSERQLQEVLVDFWSNHFNIDISKTRIVKIADEREVIRQHALGKFSDLLRASAHSPAMLVYLDNFQSVAPAPEQPRRRPGRNAFPASLEQLRTGAQRGLPAAQQMLERIESLAQQSGATPETIFDRLKQQAQGGNNAPKRGINENYARELLELHTLGVDGGYTQKDVQEVARCLTGWTIRGGRYGGEFQFAARLHDDGEKTVLGVTLPAGGGIQDGEKVLSLLANHPSTMRFVSRKLCVRLVSDDPPATLVDKCVATWKRTDGDIREIVRTIATSPEFTAKAAYRSKIKSPFEYAVSAVRALGGEVKTDGSGALAFNNAGARSGNPRTIEGQINQLGQPLYRYAFPTGWPEDSRKWVSSGALIGRINYALALAGGEIADVQLSGVASRAAEGKSGADLVDALTATFLNGEVSPSTRATLIKQVAATPKNESLAEVDLTRRITALVLGAPEFQRR